MTTCVSYKRSAAFALAAAFLSTSIHAQTGELSPTVVTATRTAQSLGEIVADVSVIDRAEIERSGAVGLSDLLMRLPGVEMARNGGPGTTTSVYLRGAETRFTAVYIDGVRIDSQSTGGATWEGIPLAQIERVEVLRGPASAIYGSDAIGGVIQIFTRKGEGPFTPNISIGAGSHQSGRVQAGFSGAQQGLDYSVSVARETSEGFNARPVAGQNPDKDGYQQTSANARLGWQFHPDQRLEMSALSNDMISRSDTSSADNRNLHRLQTAGLNWQARWSDRYSTKVSVTDSDTRYETSPDSYLTQTRLRGYLWQNEFRQGAQLITAAIERREDELDNSSTISATTARSQNGLALGYGWTGRAHTWQLHARHDDDSEFGAKNTGSVGYGYALTPRWRLTASVATAFRAPTLYQRFSSRYGVATLLPEYSRNVEVGARHTQGSSTWGVVLYRNRVENLITYSSANTGCTNSPSGCYGNTAEAEYLGMTVSGQQMLSDVRVRASFDLQDPHDRQTDKKLARRAQRYLNLGADTRLDRWSVGSDLRLSSERYDTAANTTVLPGYALLSVYAQTRLSPDWSLLFKVDNATDAQYQLANTYATAGRSFFVTLKWEPSARSTP